MYLCDCQFILRLLHLNLRLTFWPWDSNFDSNQSGCPLRVWLWSTCLSLRVILFVAAVVVCSTKWLLVTWRHARRVEVFVLHGQSPLSCVSPWPGRGTNVSGSCPSVCPHGADSDVSQLKDVFNQIHCTRLLFGLFVFSKETAALQLDIWIHPRWLTVCVFLQ